MLLTINKELADSDTSHNVQAEAACACSVLFLLVILTSLLGIFNRADSHPEVCDSKSGMTERMRACVRVRACACVRACVRACVCVAVRCTNVSVLGGHCCYFPC
jgi:hypothetical protein